MILPRTAPLDRAGDVPKREGLYERFAVDEYSWSSHHTAPNTFPIIFFYGCRQLRIVDAATALSGSIRFDRKELSKLHLERLHGDTRELVEAVSSKRNAGLGVHGVEIAGRDCGCMRQRMFRQQEVTMLEGYEGAVFRQQLLIQHLPIGRAIATLQIFVRDDPDRTADIAFDKMFRR